MCASKKNVKVFKTSYLEIFTENVNLHHYLWVDIVFFDNLPETNLHKSKITSYFPTIKLRFTSVKLRFILRCGASLGLCQGGGKGLWLRLVQSQSCLE